MKLDTLFEKFLSLFKKDLFVLNNLL